MISAESESVVLCQSIRSLRLACINIMAAVHKCLRLKKVSIEFFSPFICRDSKTKDFCHNSPLAETCRLNSARDLNTTSNYTRETVIRSTITVDGVFISENIIFW